MADMRHPGSIPTLLVLIAALAGTAACATPDQWAEWRQHPSHFASGSHLAFSVTHQGEHPTAPVSRQNFERARAEAWWGDPLMVRPDQVVDVRPEGR
jgi:hypothetical protein